MGTGEEYGTQLQISAETSALYLPGLLLLG
jgi:hypothetical protein